MAPTSVKLRELQADGAGGRALADQDVETAVLHGGVEHLLDGAVQAVDLVDEEHVAVLQVGQQRGEIAGPGQDRAGGDAEPGAHLGGHDPGQGRLAQPGRPREEDVVHGLAPLPGRLQHDPQMLDQFGLPEELGERPRPEPDLLGSFGAVRNGGIDDRAARVVEPVGLATRLASTASTSRRARGLTGSPRGQLAQRQPEHLFHPDIVA